LAPPDDPLWASFGQPVDSSIEKVRILKSHSTPGVVFHRLGADGSLYVIDFPTLVDLLYLNIPEWFRTHPEYTTIYVELRDLEEVTASSAATDASRLYTVGHSSSDSGAASVAESDTSSTAEVKYAIFVRRSELTYDFCSALRNAQRDFFHRHGSGLPRCLEFTSTLHGR